MVEAGEARAVVLVLKAAIASRAILVRRFPVELFN